MSFDDGRTLADRMRRHAGDRDHLYGHLMRGMADDWERHGPVREICADHGQAPAGAVIQLRLLAGLFRIVLTGRAPQLEPFYPCLGGTAPPSQAWPLVRGVLASEVDELRDALTIAPQTNEVGRANALLVGIFAAVARTGRSTVRLLEPGASAGLNLLVDQFRFVNEGWVSGPEDSPVRLCGGVLGAVHPAPFRLVDRRGCDLAPIDASTAEGQLRLRSFVWPFQVERHERLTAALQIATGHRLVVDRAAAGTWLSERIQETASQDVLTVVWNSITRQYWPPEETARVAATVGEAASRMAIAHVSMEYESLQDSGASLTLAWSAGDSNNELRHEHLGSVADHGFPVRTEA